jgi:tRNA threonylcarbamoyladenosine biosynthesis protein TsaB
VIVLAAETATEIGSVALLQGEEVLAQVELRLGRGSSENLLRMADALLGLAGLKLEQIGLLCVGLGPGSFTGVRIGVVTVRTLGLALGVPVAGVSTLEALCAPWLDAEGLLVPVLDAHRGQVYAAVFRAEAGGLTRLSEEAAIEPEQLGEVLKKLRASESAFVFGPGWERHGRTVGRLPRGVEALPRLRPEAAGVARCAFRLELTRPAEERRPILPNYVRRSDAELGLRRPGREASA